MILIVLFIFSIVFSIFSIVNRKEGFSELAPGIYPLSENKPLLYENYNLVTPPSLSAALGSSDIYQDYPVFPATSTKNNNIRYWENPNNGTCAPADMCGGLYADTKQDIPSTSPPPDWSARRVNFYTDKN